MSKYCVKCGAELKEGTKFCEKCGHPVDEKVKDNTSNNSNTSSTNRVSLGVTNRNIGMAVVLSLVTCGIYALIWLVYINDDVNKVSDEPDPMSGGIVLLFSGMSG